MTRFLSRTLTAGPVKTCCQYLLRALSDFRMPCLIGVLLLMQQANATMAGAVDVQWSSVALLRSTTDQTSVQSTLDALFECQGIPTRQGHLIELLIEDSCKSAEVAQISLGGNANLLVLKIPSIANCGDFQFAILGPADPVGRRHMLGGPTLQPACAEDVHLVTEAGQRGPRVMVEGMDCVSADGKETHDDFMWEWEGADLRVIAVPGTRSVADCLALR